MTVSDLTPYTKKLVVPAGFDPPRRLEFDDVAAHAISRDDLAEDVRGINASLDLIRETRGGRWPTGPVTEEENYVDLIWHECEFRDSKSFTFVLEARDRGYIGCAYLYPLGVRAPLTAGLAQHDVDVSWWVTPDAYEAGYYERVFRALERWVVTDYPFIRPHYSNVRLPPG
ncbi:GNAT family N-acetyltransferase [Actinoplanes sp. NPDC051513]|uniref:GNAT family N-acetyltransferase n=1 Tax=Actinoplanes sp. NPDC051513 TaxID=3363908 RepID=UPI00378C6F6D